MNFRKGLPGLLGTLAVISMTGCNPSQSAPPATPANSAAPPPETTVRVHWLGKKAMQLRMGSFYLMRLWQLPESADLQARTLAQLAAAPSRWLKVPPDRSRLATPLLDRSLNDLVLNECYFEVRQPTNQAVELTFAIHLDPEDVGDWETNLANIIRLLTDEQPKPSARGIHGWSLDRAQSPRSLQFQREGDWVVFGAGSASNALFSEICDRVQHYTDPFGANATANWLVADAKLARLRDPLTKAWHLSENAPDVSLVVSGDGANVLTRGQMTFPVPLHLEIEPWTVPTNLIREPLNSLTAVRGFHPWLSSLKIWHDLALGMPPGQLYFWSLPGAPSGIYFAIPSSDASNQLHRLTEQLMAKTNPWLAAHGYVGFENLPDSNGVRWGNVSAIQPFLKYVNAAGDGVLFGGLLPDAQPDTHSRDDLYERPSLSDLLDRIATPTNLVYYDWESTGLRIEPCLYLGQVARVISRHAELPPESAGIVWLKAIEPRLTDCTTTITCTETNQITFFRKSTVGFTGAELQLLVDWLDSPQFPRGLYSLPTPPSNR